MFSSKPNNKKFIARADMFERYWHEVRDGCSCSAANVVGGSPARSRLPNTNRQKFLLLFVIREHIVDRVLYYCATGVVVCFSVENFVVLVVFRNSIYFPVAGVGIARVGTRFSENDRQTNLLLGQIL